jgi:hypothetical protein
MTQRFYQDYLGVLRRAYPGQKILLLLDRAPSHLAQPSLPLAADDEIELLWLPKQCPELNGMDQAVKGGVKIDQAAEQTGTSESASSSSTFLSSAPSPSILVARTGFVRSA